MAQDGLDALVARIASLEADRDRSRKLEVLHSPRLDVIAHITLAKLQYVLQANHDWRQQKQDQLADLRPNGKDCQPRHAASNTLHLSPEQHEACRLLGSDQFRAAADQNLSLRNGVSHACTVQEFEALITVRPSSVSSLLLDILAAFADLIRASIGTSCVSQAERHHTICSITD